MRELHRVCKNFTRHDKKSRTILLCKMLEYTNVFLEAVFRAEGCNTGDGWLIAAAAYMFSECQYSDHRV